MINELSDGSKQVLKVVVDTGSIRGFELKKQVASLDENQIVNAARQLIFHRLITASGEVGPGTLDRVRFAPLSSGLENRPA